MCVETPLSAHSSIGHLNFFLFFYTHSSTPTRIEGSGKEWMMMMSGYPTALAPLVSEETPVAGIHTPTYGGMIAGHEFDMPIGQSQQLQHQQQQQQQHRHHHQQQQEYHTPAHTIPATTTTPQRVQTIRPRPVSMPPQSHAPQVPTLSSDENGNRERRKHREDQPSSRRSGRRTLGDYTLSKTLGAGSMGQVRLASHNVSGEKVCFSIPSYSSYSFRFWSSSWPSKFSLVSIPTHLRRPTVPVRIQNPSPLDSLRKMPQRKQEHFEKPPFPCFSTIPTSAVCER